MLDTKTIFQGETPTWHAGHDTDGAGTMADLSTGYACQVKVLDTAINRAVTALTDDKFNFIVSLTSAETAALVPGTYIVAIQLSKAAINFDGEDHGILVIEGSAFVAPYAVEPPTRIERLQAREAALEDALDEAISGGVSEVWNGRYGNRMKYEKMTYAEIETALIRVRAQIDDETRKASGGGIRSPIGVSWERNPWGF